MPVPKHLVLEGVLAERRVNTSGAIDNCREGEKAARSCASWESVAMHSIHGLRAVALALAASSAMIAASYAADPSTAPSPAPSPTATTTPASAIKPAAAHGPWGGDAPGEAGAWHALVLNHSFLVQARFDLDFAKACGSQQDVRNAAKRYQQVSDELAADVDAYLKLVSALSGVTKPDPKNPNHLPIDEELAKENAYAKAVAKVMAELEKQDPHAKLIKACPSKDVPVTPGPLKAEQRQQLIDDALNYKGPVFQQPPTQLIGPDGKPVQLPGTGASRDDGSPYPYPDDNKTGTSRNDTPPYPPAYPDDYRGAAPYGVPIPTAPSGRRQ
jgi:hypothetical protein